MQTSRQVLLSIFFLIVFPIFAQAAINDGLIAYWNFDACDLEDSGPAGFNAGAMLGDPMCVQGAQGFAFAFDGVDDFIRIPDVPVEPTQHSYALWFRPAEDLDSNSPRQDLLYADVDIDIILQTLGRPHITLNHPNNDKELDGKIGFHPHIIPDNGGNPLAPDSIKSSTDTWQANRWYHAAFTWDGATFRIYIDGALEQTFTLPSGVSNTYEGIVLAVRGNEEFFFNGSLDEVRIYDRVLTPEEVRELAVPDPAVLTVVAEGSGTGRITSAPQGVDCGADCSEPYDLGAMVTLTATPDANSVFSGWQGGGCSGTDDCIVAMDEDITVVATFERLFNLSVAKTLVRAAGGDVTSDPAGIDCGDACEQSFLNGAMVTLTATPDANSVFSGWQGGGCADETPTCVVQMDQDHAVTATFEPRQVTLQVAANGAGNGAVSSNPAGVDCGADCSELYDIGAMVTLTATPDANSVFSGWQGGGCADMGDCIVTMNADITVEATFERVFNLTVTKTLVRAADGAVTSSPAGIDCGGACAQSLLNGAMVTLTAMPNANSTFVGWQGNGCAGETPTCVVQMNQDRAVTATFAPVQVALQVVKNGSGSGIVSSNPAGVNCGADCSELYDIGAVVTLTATPDANTAFSGWQGGGCAGAGDCTITMTAGVSVTATFALGQTSLTVVKNGNGDGVVTSSPPGIDCGAACQAAFPSQTEVTLSAAPDADTRFVGWNRDDCSGEGPCTVALTSALTLTATFENPPPVALAGDDQTVDEGVKVTLDASNSTDFNAEIARYQWHQLSGPTVVLSDEMPVQVTFMAPAAPQEGVELEFQLEVVDRRGLSATDRILITVLDTNIPPLANAGADQTVEAGALVTLNGSASSDMDGDLTDTIWMQTAGAAVTLSDPTALQPTFTAPSLVGEVLQFELTVIDDGGLSDTDSVSIDIVAAGERDEDVDGVADDVEDGAPNGGDGNGDGVPDRQQAHVASLPNQATGEYVTLVAPAHTALVNVRAIPNPSSDDAPANIDFPIGFLEFAVHGLAPGEAAAVTLFLPPDVTPEFYYKFGATADEPAPHWYEFDFDGATGAELANDQAQLHFIDGERGDDDLTANGEVFDPGAIAVAIAPTSATLQITKNGSGSGSVSSDPAGVNCGADCEQAFDIDAVVTLTATPDGNSRFAGWQGGGCSGAGNCVVTITADTSVTATFETTQGNGDGGDNGGGGGGGCALSPDAPKDFTSLLFLAVLIAYLAWRRRAATPRA